MLSAVHSDRSGRIVLAADVRAAMFDGAAVVPIEGGLPLPPGADLVTLDEREAEGLDRAGRARPLGQARFAVGAILPRGHLRLGLPAYVEDERTVGLAPRTYAPVAADENGQLVAAAKVIDDPAPDRRETEDLAARMRDGLRQRPGNQLVRQLARCARDYACRAAANAFLALADCAIPVAAPANEDPPAAISLRADADAAPREPARLRASAAEIADVAVAHLTGGGGLVAFGRACEGEPLLAARVVEQAIAAIRERTKDGILHLETNGSDPAGLRRLARAGLDSVAFRVASARAETYERIHRPVGYRVADVRASIAAAVAERLAVSLIVLFMPGITDRGSELDALVDLAGALPLGSALLLRDLAADPHAALALVRTGEPPLGVERALARLAADAPHVRLGAIPRPLARV